MSNKSSENQYGSVAVTIHWLTALLILILLGSGLRSEAIDDPAAKIFFLRIHVPLGLTLLVLTVARIVWWVKFDKKPIPIPMPDWQSRLSKVVHILLYAIILGMSSSGIGIMVLSGAGPFIFAGADLANFPNFWDYLPRTPHGVVSKVLIGLLFLHIGAALYHHFIKRDGLLRRIGIKKIDWRTLMNIFTQLAVLLLGLLSGALLLLALAFVPYWQSLQPLEFTQWFGTNVHFIASVMKPLGFSATGVVWLATGLAVWKKLPTRHWLIAASVCAFIMLITFPAFFASANAALAEGAMSAAEITQKLAQWESVHWVRVIAAIAGCFCALKAGYVNTDRG